MENKKSKKTTKSLKTARAKAKNKKITGRPRKLNKELIKNIGDGIEKGHTIGLIVGALGISENIFYKWMAKGDLIQKRQDNGERIKKEDLIYLYFLQIIRKAKLKLQSKYIDRISQASEMPNNWTAAAWMLERKFRKDFGNKLEVDANVEASIVLVRPDWLEKGK